MRILIVGGDKHQDRNEPKIRRQLEGTVEVEFVNLGWDHHESSFLSRLRRPLERADGLFLHRFMRTNTFRAVIAAARAAGVPWEFAASGGAGSMVEAALRLSRAQGAPLAAACRPR